ncbi:AAA family ATPase [Listeria monocytogenes]|nr:AAA family ATPase [Listeria monocytogenes]EIF6133511.1 AAA family ATPase [Listeria monocytogenes]EIM8286775.1 AAA family ATPase [Listeria monocytogenes]
MKFGKQEYTIIGFLDNIDRIKIGANDYLYFWLTPISDFPNSVSEDITGIQIYANELEKYFFFDDRMLTIAERAQALETYLKNSLIICTPVIKKSDEDGRVFCQGGNIKVIGKNPNFNPEIKLLPIPMYNQYTQSNIITQDTFEDILFNEKIIGKTLNFSKDSIDYPEYVIWENGDSDRVIYGEISGQLVSQYGVQYTVREDSRYKGKLDEDDIEWSDSEYIDENITFIPLDILSKKIKKIKSMKQTILSSSDKNKLNDVDTVNGSMSTSSISPIKMSSSDFQDQIKEVVSPELEFIKWLKYITRKQYRLFYETKDLINFHAAMKGDSLVVLSGLSGTGKSQLVTAYAKALQLSPSQLKFISVRPFWEDDSDLLGYADTVNSVYRPGDSGLIDVLIEASNDPNNLYLVCFDEMNLARVEHYFSQFLSVLEMESGKRNISLYNRDLENRLYNSASYPHEISVGTNVLFVGTINTDESTHQFSDKVLDRSNIISLQLVPFGQTEIEEEFSEEMRGKNETLKFDDFKTFRKSSPSNALTVAEKNMFWEIHLAMNERDKNVGIGWRILKQIDEYLQNIPMDTELSRTEALDYQLVQRVLTKIRGSEEQLADLLGRWDKSGNKMENSILEEILDKYLEYSNFEYSRKIIKQKSRELILHGFTI